jgi:acyl carrier protein
VSGAAVDEVAAWLSRRRPDAGAITPDIDLIDNRIVDSLGFLELIGLVERLSGRQIDPDTLDLDDFRSLRRIEQAFLR